MVLANVRWRVPIIGSVIARRICGGRLAGGEPARRRGSSPRALEGTFQAQEEASRRIGILSVVYRWR